MRIKQRISTGALENEILTVAGPPASEPTSPPLS